MIYSTKNNLKLSLNERKFSMNRPFSGGQSKFAKPQKSAIKPIKPKQRPKTAKKPSNLDENLNKSPSSLKFLSPKSSKKGSRQNNKQAKSSKGK